jgi:hypothetical protein
MNDVALLVVNRHRYLPTPGVGPRVQPRTGRERRPELPQPWIYVGRGSPLGNPFTREEHGDAALELYRRWLFERIRQNDSRVLLQLRSIRPGAVVVCSCAPKPCHADVVVRAWAWLRDRGLVP